MLRRISAPAAMVGLLANVVACSGDETDNVVQRVADTNTGGAAMTDITPSTGGAEPDPTMNMTPVDTQVPPVNSMDGVILEGDEQEPVVREADCAGTVFEPETLTYVKPVMMYIVLDNSKSMIEGAKNGEPTKWEQAVTAFTEFAQDPVSSGIDIGIQYFNPSPPPEVVAAYEAEVAAAALDPTARPPRPLRYSPDECDGIAHAQSAMEVGPLPASADAFIQSLAEADPRSNTPTVGALTGGVNFCKEFQRTHPEEECVLVFVTDGQPNGCGLGLGCSPGLKPNALGQCTDPKSEGMLSPIVKDAHDNDGVRTYTVGMDGVNEDGFDLLNTLAQIGGTDCTPNEDGKEACDVSVTGGAGLLAALTLIRDTIVKKNLVPCRWAIPEPEPGKRVDPGLVNVSLTLKGADLGLLQVPTAADCSPTDGGWYYDMPRNPAEIRTCEQTCGIINDNEDDVRVSLQFGCATKTATSK